MRRVSRSRAAAQANYDRLSRWYDRLAGSEKPLQDLGLAQLAAQPGEQIVELGCGTGYALAALAQAVGPAGRVCGLDLAAGMLRVAHRRLETTGVADRVTLLQGDATAPPFPTGQFDAAFLSFTLELFDTPEMGRVLAQVKRMLHKNGRLCVVALGKENAGTAVRLYEWFHERMPAIVDCRPIFLAPLLRDAGFALRSVSRHRLWGLPVTIALVDVPG